MKLLINPPSGGQELIDVYVGGAYYDLARVLWDERIDGPMPAITLGGMTRVGNTLVLDSALLAIYTAAQAAKATEVAQIASVEVSIATDTTIATLKAMTNAEFDTWWSANVTTLAQANGVLKRLARLVLRRVL